MALSSFGNGAAARGAAAFRPGAAVAGLALLRSPAPQTGNGGRVNASKSESRPENRDDTVSSSTSAGDNIRGATDFGPRGG